jgi:hypothetical protein
MMTRDQADNVIVTGHINANNIYTRKYNKFGVLLWESVSTSGIASQYEKPYWVRTDGSGNVFVVGYRYALGTTFDAPLGIVVVKYSAAGAQQWKQFIPVTFVQNNLNTLFARGELDAAGNIYVATSSANKGGFVLVKMNPTGSIVFNTSLASGPSYLFHSMRVRGNRVVLTGRSGTNTFNVIAYNTSGSLLWNKSFPGRLGKDLEIDASNITYALSSLPNQSGANTGEDILLYRLNANGNQTWVRKFHFTGQEFPKMMSLAGTRISILGSVVPAGAAYSDWLTFQVNTTGNVLWQKTYNQSSANDENAAHLVAKTNGEVFVTGAAGPSPVPGNLSGLRWATVKYSSTGAEEWVENTNIFSGFGVATALASDNSLFVLGSTSMTAMHLFDHTGTGSCGIPAGLQVSNIGNTDATCSWTAVAGAYAYHLRYKSSAATDWTTISTDQTTVNLTGLAQQTNYEVSVEAICNSGPSGYSALQTFTTGGGGYCATNGSSQATEYLSYVWIGTIQNFTQSNNGYADFTNLSTNMAQGASVSGIVDGLMPYPEYENFYIWIDFNQDNDFNDPGENVVSLYTSNSGWKTVNFSIPANALLGATRMRVTIKHGTAPSPCGTYERGETEDYTVVITNALGNANAEARHELGHANIRENISLSPNPATTSLILAEGHAALLKKARVFNMQGAAVTPEMVFTEQLNIDVQALAPGMYIVQILSENGQWSSKKFIKN